MMPTSSPSDLPEPDSEDGSSGVDNEPVLVVEPLEPGNMRYSRDVELRQLLNVASLAVLLVLGLVGGFAIQQLRSGGSHADTASNVHSVVTSPGQGWNPRGTANAQDIAFAPTAPTRAYDCGAPTPSPSFVPVPIYVAVSSDTGRTWRVLPSPGTGITCNLTVNPANALDVVLMVSPSTTFAFKAIALYRTFDGGLSWVRWAIPPRLGTQTGDAEYVMWTWAGSTLFIAPYFPGALEYTDLAASIAGRPFVWVQRNGLFRGAPSDAGINQLFGTSRALYVVLSSQTSCFTVCTWVLASADGGASWARYTPTFQGHVINLMSQSIDGQTLFGSYFDNPAQAAREYVYSPDSGSTWRQLTPLPPQSIASNMLASPDGTFYAVLDTDPAALSGTILPGVYRLTPDARSWTYVAPPLDDAGGQIVLSWDAAGRPIALWGNILANIGDGIRPGLQSHPA